MINDTDVCKHCHRVVGEVPKYHCPKSPTGMHEAVTLESGTPASILASMDQLKEPPEPHELETIDITPVGCQTPEGAARVSAAKQAFEDITAEVANAATDFFHEHRYTLIEAANGTVSLKKERDALRQDRHQLDLLIDARRRKQEEFLRAVAGAPPAGAPPAEGGK